MRRARAVLAGALLLAACTRSERGPEPVAPPPGPAPVAPGPAEPESPGSGLPGGFAVRGEPVVEPAWLPPRAAWRELVSRLTTLRADAGRSGSDLLVTLAPGALHATDREGRRRTWRLPPGLRLAPTPVHLLLQADLGLRAWSDDGTEIPLGEEVTLVTGIASEGGLDVEEFRLVVKGGRSFRSISQAG